MSNNEMYHIVEFRDIIGEPHLIVFSSRVEAQEFIDLGLKRWHFADPKYHWYSIRELAEEKVKLS
jgi:hypothetical protein